MKKTLVILGTHPDGLKTFDWKRGDCDVWMFNEAPNFKDEKGDHIYRNPEAFFQIHHEAIWKNPKNRLDPGYYQWLSSGKTPTAYMQEVFKDVPNSTRYPIEDVLKMVKNIRIFVDGNEKKFKYFSSSPDFALALVAQMWKKGKCYERVEIHGIGLELESEYQYQRTGFGFWIGYLSALGIEVILYNSIFDAPMYGYEGDVALKSSDIEKRLEYLTCKIGIDKKRYQDDAKNFLDSIHELLDKDVSVQIQKDFDEINKNYETTGILNGQIEENKKYLERAKAMETASAASVFAMGEFNEAQVAANVRFAQTKMEMVGLNKMIKTILKRLLVLKKNSQKRMRMIDEFGQNLSELMNKNMLLLNLTGIARENEYYINSFKLSLENLKEGNR